jgi:hypothetical protein
MFPEAQTSVHEHRPRLRQRRPELHLPPSSGPLILDKMSEREVSVPLPLDSDGFLRRECPTCEREFKWLHSQGEDPSDNDQEHPTGGYFCPYCAVQAPDGSWWTKAQLEFVEAVGVREFVGPELDRLSRSVRDIGSSSDGLIEATFEAELPEEPAPLREEDDMRRVEFACHPSEPVKVLDEWSMSVHCLLCGETA